LRRLLEKGANVEARDIYGQTALHKATNEYQQQGKCVLMVRLLLEKGADVKAKDKDGDMALHKASRNGH
jgi:ankyrin repeat protein